MGIRDAEQRVAEAEAELREARGALKRAQADLPALRAAVDAAPTDVRRKQAERRLAAHRQAIGHMQTSIADLELSFDGAKHRRDSVQRLLPAVKAKRRRALELCNRVERDIGPALEAALQSVVDLHGQATDAFKELDALAADADASTIIGPQKVALALGEILWSRLGRLAGLPAPHRIKPRNLEQVMARGRVVVRRFDEELAAADEAAA